MKYWLSTLPEDMPLQRMVFEAKMRWRIERDYQDLKQEVGLGKGRKKRSGVTCSPMNKKIIGGGKYFRKSQALFGIIFDVCGGSS